MENYSERVGFYSLTRWSKKSGACEITVRGYWLKIFSAAAQGRASNNQSLII
jgi:hypothetical protein